MQTMIAEDYVNGFLFQLAKTGVAKRGHRGPVGELAGRRPMT